MYKTSFSPGRLDVSVDFFGVSYTMTFSIDTFDCNDIDGTVKTEGERRHRGPASRWVRKCNFGVVRAAASRDRRRLRADTRRGDRRKGSAAGDLCARSRPINTRIVATEGTHKTYTNTRVAHEYIDACPRAHTGRQKRVCSRPVHQSSDAR